jgi:membrane protease YdiL (CAAX protease family)
MTYWWLLMLAVAIVVWSTISDRKDFALLKTYRGTKERQKFYLKWLFKSLTFFGLMSLVALVGTGNMSFLWQPKIVDWQIWPWIVWVLVAIVTLVVTLAFVNAKHSKMSNKDIKVMKDVLARDEKSIMIPRNRVERRYGVVLALTAGVVEELFLRALLPVCLIQITENTMLAAVLSVLVFGIAHLYQGVKGILSATLIGAVFMLIFALTSNIFVVMILHFAVDFYGLVINSVQFDRAGLFATANDSCRAERPK